MKYEKLPFQTDQECARNDAFRASITLICEVRQGMRPWAHVRMRDISQTGFQIAWFPGVDMNKPLRIKIPGLQLLSAHVRWQREKAIGCEFTESLHVAVFEHIARSALAQGGH